MRFDNNIGSDMRQILLERSRTHLRNDPRLQDSKPLEIDDKKFKQKSYGKMQMKKDFVKVTKMVKTKEEYAQIISEDADIIEQFVHAQDEDDFVNIVESIINKYETLKVLR